MAYSTVTLTGRLTSPSGRPHRGSVSVTPSVSKIIDADGDVVLAGRSLVKLVTEADATEATPAGSFSVTLPATDDPGLNPTGFTYLVRVELADAADYALTIDLPAAVPVVDLADKTEADPSAPTYTERVNEATEAATAAGESATMAASSATTASTAATTAQAAATEAETSAGEATTAAGQAATSAASIAVGEPGGVAPLDETGNLPEANVPERLSAVGLSTTFAARQVALAPEVAPAMKPDWITTFPAGHGWTADGTSSYADVTTDPALGAQAVNVVSTTASGQVNITKTGLPAIDATGKVFVVWIKTPDVSKIASMNLLLGAGNFGTFYYTLRTWLSGAAAKPTLNNRWTPIYFTFNADNLAPAGTPNIVGITDVKLRLFGSSAVSASTPLDVTVGGIGLVDDGSALYPNGVVTFTFDDGYDTQYAQARAALDKHGFPATLYTIVEAVGAAGRISLDQLKHARDVSGWEIAGHAYSENAHTNRLTSLTDAELEAEMANLKAWLVDNGFSSDNYCYPGGVWTAREVAAASRYFSTARTTSTQPPHTLVPPPDPMLITMYDPGSGGASALANAKAQVDNAKADRSWIQFMVHRIGAGGMPESDFISLVDYCAEQGVAVRTVQQVMRAASVEAPPVVVASGGGEPSVSNVQTAYKVADTTRNNTATRTADPDLTLPVEANATYLVEAFLAYQATTTADVAVRFEGPAGQFPTMRWGPLSLIGPAMSATSATGRGSYTNVPVTLGADGANTEARPMGYVTIGATGGNFSLTWAQAVAEVSDAIMRAGSWLRLTKVN